MSKWFIWFLFSRILIFAKATVTTAFESGTWMWVFFNQIATNIRKIKHSSLNKQTFISTLVEVWRIINIIFSYSRADMTGKSKLLKNENVLFNLTFRIYMTTYLRHTKKYLRFENDLENFEVDKIGFLIKVTLATNICLCGLSFNKLEKIQKKWFTTICCL